MDLTQVKDDIEKAVSGVKLKPVRDSLLIETPADLLKVAEYLKNDAKYQLDYLSSITASDYVDFLESVYHLYSTVKKHGPVTLRVRVKPDAANMPSLVPLYRGAEFQERDNYDLYGIFYEGHPDLRRILMWEGFEGFPMRKNYVQEDSDTLDETDLEWLQKNNIQVPDDLMPKPESKKTDTPAKDAE